MTAALRWLATPRAAHLMRWAIVLAWIVAWTGLALRWWRFGNDWLGLFFASIVAIAALSAWAAWRREREVRESPLPQFLKRKLRDTYPQLSAKDCDLVERGLRQFFLACLRSRGAFVSMPSRVVDAMWHEFILHTRAYDDWCQRTLGRFLHHTPAEVLGVDAGRNDGLRRAWFWACKDEAIDPRTPTRLPLLFALDAKLGIAGGFVYVADCEGGGVRRDDGSSGGGGGVHCATEFSDASHSGSADDFGGAEASSSGGPDGDSGCGGD